MFKKQPKKSKPITPKPKTSLIVKKSQKVEKDSKEEDDYEEFDFSIYSDQDDAEEEIIADINRIPRSEYAKTKSKYSPHFLGLERLERMRVEITRCSIKVASNTQYVQDLWDLFGALNEYWANIKDLSGRSIYDQVDRIFLNLAKHLTEAQKKDSIPYTTHLLILTLRDRIYVISQRLGFSFEVDFKKTGLYATAQRGIKD